MKDRLKKLVDLKSIITILLTATFIYLAVIGKVDVQTYMTVFIVVIGFYFGSQALQNKGV